MQKILTATHWGLVYAHVENGKLIKLTPHEKDPAPSPNLEVLSRLPYSQTRIRYPMVRRGFLKGQETAATRRRGTDEFVRITWDKAMDLVADNLKNCYDHCCPSSVFGQSYGWKSPGSVNAAASLQRRLLNILGGYTAGTNSYSTAAIGTILPYVTGMRDPKVQSWEILLKHSEQIVFWGCDPIVTNDVDWTSTLHQGTDYLRRLKATSIKTLAINPVKPETARELGSEWIPVRPSTDCALMLGLIHELHINNLIDRDFISRCVAGWDRFMEYVLGKTDGTVKSAEWASAECGVPAETIRRLAYELKSGRTMLMIGWGMQRQQFGEQPTWMAYALACALGQIGLAGGGIGTNYHYSSGGAVRCVGPILGSMPAKVEPVRKYPKAPVIPVARFVDMLENPGKTIRFNGKEVTYPEIHMILWTGGNPFAHQPETFRLEKAWQKPDCIVVSDTVWSPTARHADIVLPACTSFEREDITSIGTYTNDGIVMMNRVIEPMYESRSDYWIYSHLAEKLGVSERFTEGRSESEWIRKFYEDARKSCCSMPDFETFKELGCLFFEKDSADSSFIDYADFRADPASHPLATESGKFQIYSEKIAAYGYADCSGYPRYFEPRSAISDHNKGYPIRFISSKSKYRLHSQLDNVQYPQEQGNVREPLLINTSDAEERGIQNGDLIKVWNDEGCIIARTEVSDDIMAGCARLCHGGWFEPVDGFDNHGNSNSLTKDVPTSELANGNVATIGAVQVAKLKDEVPQSCIWQEIV